MFNKFRHLLSKLSGKSNKTTPINKVSLIVIILIDIFILINVFIGLNDISGWILSPDQSHPCYSEWRNYRADPNRDDYQIIASSVIASNDSQVSSPYYYPRANESSLGKVSPLCSDFADRKDKVNSANNQQIGQQINQKQQKIETLEQSNRRLREEYDSTLLEKIAGQDEKRSLNQVTAEKAKQAQDKNNLAISTLKAEVNKLKLNLISNPESIYLIALLKDTPKFEQLQQSYQQASVWYPSIQIALQAAFLLPLMLLALSVHNWAQRKSYGLVALISWHLLVILCIPLIAKIFEFLQFGAIARFVFDIISKIFGGLLFLVSYVYIFVIPLIGFGLIKFLQKIVASNSKSQASIRVQKSSCIQCDRKIQPNDLYCSHCGYYQYIECQNCHKLTHKHLNFCRHCGNESGHE